MAEKEHAQEVWTIVPVSAFLILVITMNYSPDDIVLLDLVCLISRQKIKNYHNSQTFIIMGKSSINEHTMGYKLG